jgi:nucleotide-binding universal stress UspA family protein
MVHLDLEHHPNEARLRVAADLAEQWDAWVIGIAACDPQPLGYAGAMISADLVQDTREGARRQMAATEAGLREGLKALSGKVEWRSAFARPTDYVARQARAADLLIVGANKGGGLLDPYWRLDPGALVMAAGRPVLIVPEATEHLAARRIVVGWKDTAEARRAVFDALPLLRGAEKVFVAAVERDEEYARTHKQLDDLVKWLARHGVPAEARCLPPVSEAAIQLDTLAWEEGADLIVAGAYGHSRLREWAFGGVTRDLLTRTSRCSFLSH